MDVSRIFLVASRAEAQQKFAEYRSRSGCNTVLIGPTDTFRISGHAPNKIEWNSGDGHDWYMVVVTRSDVWTAGDGVVEGPE